MDFNNMNHQNQNNNPYGNSNPYNSPVPPPSGYTPMQKSPADGMVNAAMILGISAIVSALLMTVYFPFILGGISIIMAILSKGHEQKMISKAKAGILCSIVGIVLNFIIVIGSVYTVFTDETAFRYFDQMYEAVYGDSFSDTYEELTGEEFFIN